MSRPPNIPFVSQETRLSHLSSSGGPSGLSLIVLWIVIAALVHAVVIGSLMYLIPAAVSIVIGLWAAKIIAGD